MKSRTDKTFGVSSTTPGRALAPDWPYADHRSGYEPRQRSNAGEDRRAPGARLSFKDPLVHPKGPTSRLPPSPPPDASFHPASGWATHVLAGFSTMNGFAGGTPTAGHPAHPGGAAVNVTSAEYAKPLAKVSFTWQVPGPALNTPTSGGVTGNSNADGMASGIEQGSVATTSVRSLGLHASWKTAALASGHGLHTGVPDEHPASRRTNRPATATMTARIKRICPPCTVCRPAMMSDAMTLPPTPTLPADAAPTLPLPCRGWPATAAERHPFRVVHGNLRVAIRVGNFGRSWIRKFSARWTGPHGLRFSAQAPHDRRVRIACVGLCRP
jgi:hypothetical protein